MENERPWEEASSSGPNAFAGSLFPLPIGYRLEQYTIQALVGASAEEITYVAADDSTRDGTVILKEYFPDDVAMRLSDQTVSSILEADEQRFRDGMLRFMGQGTGSPAGRNGSGAAKVFEANNTAYRVLDPMREVGAAPAGWSPWRYFAIGAGAALTLVVLGAAGYFYSTRRDQPSPPPRLAAAAPAAVAATSTVAPTTTVPTTAPPVVSTTLQTTFPTTTLPPVSSPAGAARIAAGVPSNDDHKAVPRRSAAKSHRHERAKIDIAGNKSKTAEVKSESKGPTTFLILDVEPSGRIYVDGRMVGSTPPLTRVPITPGRHRVEIHGDLPPGIYYYRVNIRPGENQPLTARFDHYAY